MYHSFMINKVNFRVIVHMIRKKNTRLLCTMVVSQIPVSLLIWVTKLNQQPFISAVMTLIQCYILPILRIKTR